jgi:hypothetical protein
MKKLQPSRGPSKRFEDLTTTKLTAVELTEADLGQVSGGLPAQVIKKMVAETVKH